jgi:hypothetical protein
MKMPRRGVQGRLQALGSRLLKVRQSQVQRSTRRHSLAILTRVQPLTSRHEHQPRCRRRHRRPLFIQVMQLPDATSITTIHLDRTRQERPPQNDLVMSQFSLIPEPLPMVSCRRIGRVGHQAVPLALRRRLSQEIEALLEGLNVKYAPTRLKGKVI